MFTIHPKYFTVSESEWFKGLQHSLPLYSSIFTSDNPDTVQLSERTLKQQDKETV